MSIPIIAAITVVIVMGVGAVTHHQYRRGERQRNQRRSGHCKRG